MRSVSAFQNRSVFGTLSCPWPPRAPPSGGETCHRWEGSKNVLEEVSHGMFSPPHGFPPITSLDGPLLGFKNSRSRGKDEKLRQEKAKMRKRTKH